MLPETDAEGSKEGRVGSVTVTRTQHLIPRELKGDIEGRLEETRRKENTREGDEREEDGKKRRCTGKRQSYIPPRLKRQICSKRKHGEETKEKTEAYKYKSGVVIHNKGVANGLLYSNDLLYSLCYVMLKEKDLRGGRKVK